MADQRIFVFTGTSGSGRKTAAHRIAAETGIAHVSSCTDREPRDRTRPDLDYHYVSKDRFTELAASGAFIEAVTIGKQRYGILKSELDAALATGRSLYLVLNREGADAIKRIYGETAVRLFLYVDKQTVRERLESKGTPYEVVESYLDHYTEEVSYRKQCEHVVENLSLTRTIEQLKAIIAGY